MLFLQKLWTLFISAVTNRDGKGIESSVHERDAERDFARTRMCENQLFHKTKESMSQLSLTLKIVGVLYQQRMERCIMLLLLASISHSLLRVYFLPNASRMAAAHVFHYQKRTEGRSMRNF